VAIDRQQLPVPGSHATPRCRGTRSPCPSRRLGHVRFAIRGLGRDRPRHNSALSVTDGESVTADPPVSAMIIQAAAIDLEFARSANGCAISAIERAATCRYRSSPVQRPRDLSRESVFRRTPQGHAHCEIGYGNSISLCRSDPMPRCSTTACSSARAATAPSTFTGGQASVTRTAD
jgi:hypothetical protein